jgi:transposase
LPAGSKIYLSLQPVDMRKGFDGLAAQAQQILARDPFSGHLFLFHGRRGDRLKALWWDGGGLKGVNTLVKSLSSVCTS